MLVCLREGGGLCPALEKVCATEKVWAGVLKGKEAFLWQPDAIGAAGERELQLMLRLVTGLFLRAPPAQLALCGEFILRCVLYLSVHQNGPVRRAALSALGAALSASGAGAPLAVEAAERWLSALETVVKKPAEAKQAADGAGGDDGGGGGSAADYGGDEASADGASASKAAAMALRARHGSRRPS